MLCSGLKQILCVFLDELNCCSCKKYIYILKVIILMKNFQVGGSGEQPFVLSQNFLHSISKSPFPVNTGTRAAKFSSWLLEHERDLMAGGVALTSDLQCGDVLNFFSLVSSGELSISVSLPEEGVGEPGDRRGLKRRADYIEESEADSAKKLKLLGEGEINFRKEKGFPGIAVSVRRVTLPTANAIELFKDDDSCTGQLHFNSGETNSGYDSDDVKELFNSTDTTVIPGSLGDSPWQAMASFASCIMSESADEQVRLFSPGVFETVSNALQKAGDQGLSIEGVHRLIDIPSKHQANLFNRLILFHVLTTSFSVVFNLCLFMCRQGNL